MKSTLVIQFMILCLGNVCIGKYRSCIFESDLDFDVQHSLAHLDPLWNHTEPSPMRCAVDCCNDRRCRRFQFNHITQQCQGHCKQTAMKHYSSGRGFKSYSMWATDCYVMQGRLAYYNGTVTVTRSCYTCQRWDSQTPHEHGHGAKASDFQTGETMDEVANYCRVPLFDGTPTPWCYTTSISKRWELCDIKDCV